MQLPRGSLSHKYSHQGGSSNWERRRLDSKDLPSVRRLGEGLSGFLYETTWNGSKYVRKDFPLGSVHHNVFEKEAIALLDLEHPNIVMCSHYTVGKSSCSLLLQYVDENLQNVIQKRIDAQGKGKRTTLRSRVLDIDETRILMSSKAKGREIAGADAGLLKKPENELAAPFALPEALDIILKIATGVEYLHDNGIVHGDLKPKNVLVGYGGIVKLVDFGLLETKKRIKLVSKHTRHFEILIWKAPELFTKLLGPVTEDSDDPFTDSDTDEDEEIESSVIFTKSRLAMADVYSFGLICSQILGGKLMYSNLNLTQLREHRMHGFRPQLPSTCPNDLRLLIFSSVKLDPWCRPTFTDICTALKAFQSNQLPLLMEDRFPIPAALDFSMATEFKCDYCTAALDKNATLVHTQGHHGQWDLDCSMCPGCFKQFKAMLEKAKSQKSWTGWTALEKEVASLKKETESLKSELRFLRHEDPICDQLRTADPHNELVTVATKEGETMKVHRNILISRSAVLKPFLTSDQLKKPPRKHNEPAMITLALPMHPDSFRAFIQFLYTAELKPEILQKHAPELMAAGNTYKIELLTRKCEDYIVNNMTVESTIDDLNVGEQCNSEAIKAAALKRIQSNLTGFVNRKDYQDCKKKNPALIIDSLENIILDPKGSDPGSVPSLDPGSGPSTNSGLPQDHRYETVYPSLGICTCSVHPFAHSAAPEFEYHGVHFNTATPQPSTVDYVDPASVPSK